MTFSLLLIVFSGTIPPGSSSLGLELVASIDLLLVLSNAFLLRLLSPPRFLPINTEAVDSSTFFDDANDDDGADDDGTGAGADGGMNKLSNAPFLRVVSRVAGTFPSRGAYKPSSGVYICKSVVNDLRHGNYICNYICYLPALPSRGAPGSSDEVTVNISSSNSSPLNDSHSWTDLSGRWGGKSASSCVRLWAKFAVKL
jgi:hypothetical protein